MRPEIGGAINKSELEVGMMMDSIRKFGLMLVVMFSFGFGLTSVATAAPIAGGMAPGTVQAEEEVDCDEFPDHPECEEEDEY